MEKIQSFFKLISDKYEKLFPDFFKYFKKQYIKKNIFSIDNWNYNSLLLNSVNNNILFYTNNITESFNRTLNKKYIGFCRTMFNFNNAIIDTINLYKMHNIYQERKLSITRALEHYVKNNVSFDIISFKELKKIKLSYKDYMENNNLPFINDSSVDSINDSLFYEKKGEFDSLTEEKNDSLSSNEIVEKENSINKNDSDDDDDDYNNKKYIRIPTKNEKAREKNNKKNKNVSKKIIIHIKIIKKINIQLSVQITILI